MALTASRLAPDVLRLTFELLSQPDVLTVAAVSRHWRATAVLASSYYRAFVYLFNPDFEDSDAKTESFAHVVRDAEQCQYRLGLTLDITGPRPHRPVLSSNVDGDTPDSSCATCELFRDRVVPVLRRAIPLLVRLEVDVIQALAPTLLTALTASAPQLRRFSLRLHSTLAGNHGTPEHPKLPANLFSGTAPLLREAAFCGNTLLCTEAPCLANVLTLDVSLVYERGLLATVARCFPRIQHLGLLSLRDFEHRAVSIDAQELSAFARLRSMYFGPHVRFPDILPVLRCTMTRVPDLTICCDDVSVEVAPLLAVPEPRILELHESVVDDAHSRKAGLYRSTLCLRLKSATAVRCIDAETNCETVFAILGLSSAATTLTDISIDDRFVRSLLEACPALPVLERLCIIMIHWSSFPSDSEPPVAYPEDPEDLPPDETFAPSCPRLTTLTLHATEADALVSEDVLLALSCVFSGERLALVLTNGLSAVNSCAAFASVQRPISQFHRTAHAARADFLIWTEARVRSAPSPSEDSFGPGLD